MARLTVALLLLLTRSIALGLAAGALSFNCTDGSSSHDKSFYTSFTDWSSMAVCLQLILSIAELVFQMVRLFQGSGPLPRDLQLRFLIMTADPVFALATFGSTSVVLGATSSLRDGGLITHVTYLSLMWHGRLGLSCGAVSIVTVILNVFAANHPESQVQQPGGAP